MWNNLKMDLYRMVRQKSFYIAMVIMLLLYFWMTNAAGLQNNTPFASFYADKNTLVDFLYYFPKSAFYAVAVLVFLSLFFCEEYLSVHSSQGAAVAGTLCLLVYHCFYLLDSHHCYGCCGKPVAAGFLCHLQHLAVYWLLIDADADFDGDCILSESAHPCDGKQGACHSGIRRLWQYDDFHAACRYHVVTERGLHGLYSVCDIRSAACRMGCFIL